MLDLRGYVAALHEAGYAAATIARRLASLRSFFRFGLREGWVKTNPAKPLRNPRKPRSSRISYRPRKSAGCSTRLREASRKEFATGRFWKPCTPPGSA